MRRFSPVHIVLATLLLASIAWAAPRLWTTTRPMLVDGSSDAVQLTVQGHSTQTSSLLVAETSAGTDVLTLSNSGDLTLVSDSTGGNAGAKPELIGLPRIKLVGLSTGTNGSTESTSYVDDSPTGEYAPIDADVVESSSAVYYRYGSASYGAAFASTAAADDGFKRTITNDDLEANESIGMWLYSDTAITSGDLQILLTDDGGARKFSIASNITASTWTWVEVDISSLAAGTGNVVSEFGITLTSQGATNLGAFNLYLDVAYKWDATDEEALGVAAQRDGVLSVVAVATAAGSANTQSVLTELTDYLVHYESGNDFVVWLSDQSGNSTVALVAY